MRRPSDAYRLEPTRRRRGLLIGEHQPIELLRLRLVELGHEMAVAVECGLNRVVKADAAKLGSPERCRELAVPEVVGIDRRAAFTAEDKVRPPCGRSLLKGPLERRRHIDRTPRAPGLRRPERAVPE